MDSLSAANGNFAINMFKKLTENNNKCNLFFSPLSISSALAMIHLGAKANTASQMSKVLQFEKAKDVHAAFQALISEINKPGTDYLLRTANRLYGEKSFSFLDEFLGSTQKHYHADLQSVEFSTRAEDCRKEINSWVEQKTEASRLSALIDQAEGGAHTICVIAPSDLNSQGKRTRKTEQRPACGTWTGEYVILTYLLPPSRIFSRTAGLRCHSLFLYQRSPLPLIREMNMRLHPYGSGVHIHFSNERSHVTAEQGKSCGTRRPWDCRDSVRSPGSRTKSLAHKHAQKSSPGSVPHPLAHQSLSVGGDEDVHHSSLDVWYLHRFEVSNRRCGMFSVLATPKVDPPGLGLEDPPRHDSLQDSSPTPRLGDRLLFFWNVWISAVDAWVREVVSSGYKIEFHDPGIVSSNPVLQEIPL
ncbi:unnamed protein product [Ranitomeya imitator]|uniref:Serpin domain-containing protein n=1 Tax=Ranitomeya imitator TaxID=111125 RepID=A0ABN9L7X7_9NEOB|nr:unnamed protein product [Ranitomeya imitator]